MESTPNTSNMPLEEVPDASFVGPTELRQNAPAPIASHDENRYIVKKLGKAATLLGLAALAAIISQLTLSPVYGSLPSSLHHTFAMRAIPILAFVTRRLLDGWATPFISEFVMSMFPVYSFALPAVQHSLFQKSSTFGPQYGPLLTEILTYFSLIFFSYYAATKLLDSDRVFGIFSFVAGTGTAIAAYAFFILVKTLLTALLANAIGSSLLLTRTGLQLCLSGVYTALFPKTLLLCIAVGYVAHFSPHYPSHANTVKLNNTLLQHGFTILERTESLTGYISVLENVKDSYRALRCDHSLLGGEWLPDESRPGSISIPEPIYSVFTMLEAVRLVEINSSWHAPREISRNALVIGLGVGTCPKALIAHGVETTVIELDPAVIRLAIKYFGLPSNLTMVTVDAISFVQRAGDMRDSRKYDYIVHDVFTGGAEPIPLFTMELLTGLRELLKPNGTIAINYAGDMNLVSTDIVFNTVASVFTNCKAYRDQPPSADDTMVDFVNMVIFCTKASEPWNFREPVDADFLGSQLRRLYLLPKHEIGWDRYRLGTETHQVLRRGKTSELEKYQIQGAMRHWKIMRTVLPDVVWELW